MTYHMETDAEREHIPMQVCFSIIYRQGKVLHDRLMKKFGISGQQVGYVGYVCRHPGVSQEELAKTLQIDKGAVAKSVKRLVESGFVEKRRNEDDRRAYRLFPTEKAKETMRLGDEYIDKFNREVRKGMTEAEVATFESLLRKVTDNILEMTGGKRQ